MNRYLTWRTTDLREEDGVMVGADLTQEWLLPWWWSHYQKYNSFPVVFVDFGMSFEQKEWCKKRGELFPLRIFGDFIKEKEEIDPAIVYQFEDECGKYCWDCRMAWFKKPFACLQTPFRRTLWIDLDCEIRAPLQPLFDYANPSPGLAMVKDQCASLVDYRMYNSGVIAFRKTDIPIQWVRYCIEKNHLLRGDQEVFSYMLAKEKISITEIPANYNWSRMIEKDDGVLILHWHGPHGKTAIRNMINRDTLKREFQNSFQPKSALLSPDSVSAQTAYDQKDMSGHPKNDAFLGTPASTEREPTPKSSNLCKKAVLQSPLKDQLL